MRENFLLIWIYFFFSNPYIRYVYDKTSIIRKFIKLLIHYFKSIIKIHQIIQFYNYLFLLRFDIYLQCHYQQQLPKATMPNGKVFWILINRQEISS